MANSESIVLVLSVTQAMDFKITTLFRGGLATSGIGSFNYLHIRKLYRKPSTRIAISE
ncbi:hypothetical protein [Paenibacillus auburnensis]|uniref:hypothetical protein n=1 Tax=Paenibacillus auburnensis TaxID=2905649 RepID=UPI001F171ED4|nr:hypothetical protein [Paenibacillus auburnensis]